MDPFEVQDQVIAITGVHVDRYKNLRAVFVPWSDGVAIFGTNGVGKTNLLECLALLVGTPRTIALASDRISSPASDALALDVRAGTDEMPTPPDEVLPFADITAPELLTRLPALGRLATDAEWWKSLGAAKGATFAAGLATSALPQDMIDFLTDIARRPVIRYTLEQVEPCGSGALEVPRRFRRTLLTPELPVWLRALADALPDEFAPLRTALAAGDDGSTGGWPLLALPGAEGPPIDMEWLSRSRSSSEASSDLAGEFQLAARSAEEIVDCLQELQVVETADPDPLWLVHVIAADAANEELSLTIPYLRAHPVGEGPADLLVDDVRTEQGCTAPVRTTDPAFLEPFSAGERRWVDEAMATAARVMVAARDRWKCQARVLATMDQDTLIEDLLDVADAVHEEVRANGWFTAEAAQLLLRAIEGKLLAQMRRRIGQQDYLARAVDEKMFPDVRALRPRLTVRAFDEPEAHLHPSAQRQLAMALERLRLRGNTIVVASHSANFLALPGWQLVHAQRTEEGSTFSPLTPGDLDVRRALAGQMGLTRGELLTQIGYLLVVEGEGDQLVLEAFYGQRLRDAGVGIVRMHGTNNILATVDLDFVDRYLDAPLGVLLDYTRIAAVNSSRPTKELGSEEKQLRHLRRACRQRGRRVDEFALDRPDIVACLDEQIVRATVTTFPGWAPVLNQYRALHGRPSFKPWLLQKHGVDLVGIPNLQALVDRMLEAGARPTGDLEDRVRQIERAAAAIPWG